MPYVYSKDETFLCCGLGDDDFKAKAPKESNYHERAEASHLYELLTVTAPAAPKAAKSTTGSASSAPKDPPVHFYRAQCIHYGLKPFTTKATAKKHLLAAFGSGRTLAVPADVVKQREELQREWAAAKKAADARELERERANQRERRELEMEERRRREEKTRNDAVEFARIVGDATKQRSKKGKQLTLREKTARYRIVAPRMPDDWFTYARLWLEMVQSPNTGHLWIHFMFSAFSGIIRGSAAPTRTNEPCSFTWRAHYHCEGKPLYGPDNTGVLTFLGGGRIHGTLKGSGLVDFEFAGERDDYWDGYDEVSMLNGSLLGWKQGYRGINSISEARTAAERRGDYRSAKGGSHLEPREDSDSEESTEDNGSGSSENDSEEDEETEENGPTRKLTWKDTEGKFLVSSPQLREEWPDYASSDMWLKIAHSETERHVWISFDFGVLTGVMRGTAPPKASTTPCKFSWRGYEQGEGEMTFDDGNTGRLTFLGNGKLRGKISGSFLGRKGVTFTGEKVATPNVIWIRSKSIAGWKAAYRGINDAAHDRAAAARWGKWVPDVDDADSPEDSDSDAGGGRGSDGDYDTYDDSGEFDDEEFHSDDVTR